MKEDLLSEVVEVERELADNLETEDIRAREMIDNLRRSSELQISKEQKRLEETLNQALADSVKRAEKRAADILAKADATASRLERTSDEVLTGTIRKHIARILP
jgi:cell division septum initiation protein DivIVA